MGTSKVAVVRYERPGDSVRAAVELAGGLERLPARARVLVKPNVTLWSRFVEVPPWGVITTSRVVEDVVVLLKERGVRQITLSEGITTRERLGPETHADAFERLGYNRLRDRYGVKVVNCLDRPFETVDLGGGVVLNYSTDALESDFIVNLPVLKTHAQTSVSLGIKNLKGLIDIPSRQKCHSPDPERDLHYHVARLADKLPPSLTVLDGIYTLEQGPGFNGRAHRANALIASADVLSADLVGTAVLGHRAVDVPHLVHAARNRGRLSDLSDIEILGEPIESLASRHEAFFPFTADGMLPWPLAKKGVRGLRYPKFDTTVCTYCAVMASVTLQAISEAWTGQDWPDVEVLTGKQMEPTPGVRKTILFGRCMSRLHRDNPDIQEKIPVSGCPASPRSIAEAFERAGIRLRPDLEDLFDRYPAAFSRLYEGRPEFDRSHFTVE